MAIVVCRYCSKTVRLIAPLSNAYRVNGVCKDHYDIQREDIKTIVCKEIVKLNKTTDCLEACLASLQPRKQQRS